MSKRVLISGATGFIGSHLCEYMLQAGYSVRALGRRHSQRLGPRIEQFVATDLSDRTAIGRAFEGVECFIHAAGLAHVTRTVDDPAAAFNDANVAFTRRVSESAVSCGVSAMVLISSVAAADVSVSGTTRAQRLCAAYSLSKRESEAVVQQVTRESGLRALILRAPMVYGPGMKGNPLRLMRSVARGIPLPLGGIRNERHLLYVRNLAAAARFALESSDLRGTFNVDDGETISTPQLARLFASELGIPARLFTMPEQILTYIGRLGDAASRIAPFPLTSETVQRLTGSTTPPADADSVRALPGFKPPFSTSEGIRATAEWYRSNSRGNL